MSQQQAKAPKEDSKPLDVLVDHAGVIISDGLDTIVDALPAVAEFFDYKGPMPDKWDVGIAIGAALSTLFFYLIFFGCRHRQRRSTLQKKLDGALELVEKLQQELEQSEKLESKNGGKEIRIWMDGAFDMMHFGHMNAFRKGRALGTYLVVGINSDESIKKCKGPPVMNDAERTATVEGCKFVDAIEPECPYVMSEEYLAHVIEKHKIDYVVHGDDPCIVDGRDVYESAKKLGKYRSITRTEGISTTDLVGRMLLMTKSHHMDGKNDTKGKRLSLMSEEKTMKAFERTSKFLTTNRMLRLFSAGNKEPKDGDKIIYIDGGWDMFHAGHVHMLKKAKEQGDYLIVGIHNDTIVNSHRGGNHPIMNLQERTLSVLGCKYVDDVLIDAPWKIDYDMIDSLRITAVVSGTTHDKCLLSGSIERENQYSIPKKEGKFIEIPSESTLTINEISQRIFKDEARFQAKYDKKSKTEKEYYDDRYQRDTAITE